jgi:hypothetical protein
MGCPHIVTSAEGTSYCNLAEESVKRLESEIEILDRLYWNKNVHNERLYKTVELLLQYSKHMDEKDIAFANTVLENKRKSDE